MVLVQNIFPTTEYRNAETPFAVSGTSPNGWRISVFKSKNKDKRAIPVKIWGNSYVSLSLMIMNPIDFWRVENVDCLIHHEK